MRVVLVSTLLAFTEATSFLVSPDDLGARFGVSGTTFLSMIALYFVQLEQIPKVSILTRSDLWNIGNFSLLFLSIFQNGVIALGLRSGLLTERQARRHDEKTALAYVVAVLALLVWFIRPFKEYRRRARLMEGAPVT